VLVVGPSGAGKDAVISYARDRLAGDPAVQFPRRVVTRPADRALEDHDSLDAAAFAERLADGAFALHWQAHGLGYGVPRDIDAAIAGGITVVVNVSRGIVAAARRRYPRVVTVAVTAPAEVLAARLAARGRDAAASVAGRLARSVAVDADVVLDNSGPIGIAGEAFVALVEAARRGSPADGGG